jgi:hypothetical protein
VVGTWGLLTVTSGTVTPGGVLSSTATTGTTVWQQLTATTFVVSPSQTAASVTVETTNVETKWIARSSGNVGELVKISEIIQ